MPDELTCPWCVEPTMIFICSYGAADTYRCKLCKKTITMQNDGKDLVKPGLD